jgi:hypothetical protein
MVVMLCRLYGEPNATQFPMSYMLLIYYYIDEGLSFNWDDILLANLTSTITTVVGAQLGTFPSFHMSSYLLEIMCVTHQYPNMGWKWKPYNEPIHVYCKVIWEHKYITKYQKIYEHFLAPLYEFISYKKTPCMTDKSIAIINRIGDWYLMDHGTYIKFYGATKPPYLLTRSIPDKLVL